MAPEGKLTPVQYELMQILWESSHGLTVTEVWEKVSGSRDVGRTTILNLIDRLEKRGWLRRVKEEGVFRYQPSVDRDGTSVQLAEEFLDEFFGGSASNLVMSLLGSKRVTPAEVRRLREMLDERLQNKKRKGR